MRNADSSIQQLKSRVNDWSLTIKVKPTIVRVQKMRWKWGSCSTKGIITLATDLIGQTSDFQDYVIVHELLHLKVPNHGRVFKALMGVHVPTWKEIAIIKSMQRLNNGHN
jgi:predicted metal-dependent hydrolase